MATQRTKPNRRAFTLLELMLSLSLIVMATALIGSLMQMYARNFETRGDDIRRMQLARAVLNMIAEDIRSVVLEQEYDPSVLEQQLGAGGGQAAPADPAAGTSDLASAGDAAGSDAMAPEGDLADTVTTSYPPGIYGDQFTLMVDVSRLPRPDEYLVQQTSILDGTLTDVPGDIKTVTYFVQSSSSQGVADSMDVFREASGDPLTGYASGLVRRALDRGVVAYAEELGDSQRIARTGDLVAPEVIALEFAYFDSELAQWVYEWDSSQQSLPWLIQVSLAIQSATGSEKFKVEAGTPLNTLSLEDRQSYGIEVFELVVAIPGANLVAADAASADAAAGMDSLGL